MDQGFVPTSGKNSIGATRQSSWASAWPPIPPNKGIQLWTLTFISTYPGSLPGQLLSCSQEK